MKRVKSGFETELRISPVPVLALLVLLVCAFYAGVEILGYRWTVVNQVISLALSVMGLAGIGVILLARWPMIGRWATVLIVSATVHLAHAMLGLEEALPLVGFAVAIATPLISFPASIAVSVGETLLLGVWLACYPASADRAAIGVTLLSVWAALGVTLAYCQPMYQLIHWLGEYFGNSQCFLEDARDRKAQLEQALVGFEHANRQLALANERATALRTIAEEAQRSKTSFVANVSHELRTPLNMIIGLVDLMVDSPEIYAVVLPPEMREDLQVIHRNCEHLSNMVNDVLDLTRLDSGRLTLHRERVDLTEVIGDSVEAIRPLLDKKRLFIELSIPGKLPPIYCDRTRIQQVILNLVSNATRHTDHGGVTVTVVVSDHRVVVSVSDTGTGIAPEDVCAIFEPFEQGKMWRGTGGSGLGLSISRRFVELHGGEMWLESSVGVGSTFFFSLPISPPIEHMARPGHAIREDWVWREEAFRASGTSYSDELIMPRIVLHDEVGDLRSWLMHYSDDIEFVDAQTRPQIRQALQACPAHAVILNAAEPQALLRLTEQVRPLTSGTPVIGCAVHQAWNSAAAAGAMGYLVKPVSRTDLALAIESLDRPVRDILIVDDDPEVLRLFARMLTIYDASLKVSTASDGQQALRFLHESTPDLMLLDIVMDGLDGRQILAAVQADPSLPNVPVFFISAQDPVDQPRTSSVLLVTMDGGVPINKILRCSQLLSSLLLELETTPDLVLG